MKLQAFFVIAASFTCSAASAQHYTVDQDNILRTLHDSLPKGWIMSVQNDTLRIERQDSVYIVYHNHINEPPADIKKDTNEAPIKGGRKEKLEILYKAGFRWGYKTTNRVKRHNDTIYAQIERLKKQYNINSMLIQSKGKPMGADYPYEPKTADDSLRLTTFKEKEASLKQHLIEMPYGKTQWYSLFNTPHACDGGYYDFEFIDIYPKNASTEMFHICDLISEQAR